MLVNSSTERRAAWVTPLPKFSALKRAGVVCCGPDVPQRGFWLKRTCLKVQCLVVTPESRLSELPDGGE